MSGEVDEGLSETDSQARDDRRRAWKIEGDRRRSLTRRTHRSGPAGIFRDPNLGDRPNSRAHRGYPRDPRSSASAGASAGRLGVPRLRVSSGRQLSGKSGEERSGSILSSHGLTRRFDVQHRVLHPYMQRTRSLDLCIVLEGEVTLVLDTEEVPLKAGDTVVQRGCNHAWSNRSNRPCVVVISSHDAVG